MNSKNLEGQNSVPVYGTTVILQAIASKGTAISDTVFNYWGRKKFVYFSSKAQHQRCWHEGLPEAQNAAICDVITDPATLQDKIQRVPIRGLATKLCV